MCVLDNRTTAMTGRQGNPFNGVTLQNRTSRELDLEGVVRFLGVDDVRVVDPHDMMAVRKAPGKETTAATDTLSVVIFRAPVRAARAQLQDALRGDREVHGMRRLRDARLPCHLPRSRDSHRFHRSRSMHRLRTVRAILRFQGHRARLGSNR